MRCVDEGVIYEYEKAQRTQLRALGEAAFYVLKGGNSLGSEMLAGGC